MRPGMSRRDVIEGLMWGTAVLGAGMVPGGPVAASTSPRQLAEATDKPTADLWVLTAVASLQGLRQAYQMGLDDALIASVNPIALGALRTSFGWDRVSASSRLEALDAIISTFTGVQGVFWASANMFKDISIADALRSCPKCNGIAPPAIGAFNQGVWFTPHFRTWDPTSRTGFGPNCRAAMLVHEAVHVVDSRSGEDAIHIPEWMEPQFSAQTPDQSRHNPSAYATFAQQVMRARTSLPVAERWGAGRPWE